LSSPTQRTLKLLRSEGFIAHISEYWNPFAKRRIDLFGFIDIVALKENRIVGVQCTTAENRAARRTKILGLETAIEWRKAGGEIALITWRKNSSNRWVHNWEEISFE
jgi:hypothetical protein